MMDQDKEFERLDKLYDHYYDMQRAVIRKYLSSKKIQLEKMIDELTDWLDDVNQEIVRIRNKNQLP